jgi:hypothetical protein
MTKRKKWNDYQKKKGSYIKTKKTLKPSLTKSDKFQMILYLTIAILLALYGGYCEYLWLKEPYTIEKAVITEIRTTTNFSRHAYFSVVGYPNIHSFTILPRNEYNERCVGDTLILKVIHKWPYPTKRVR